MTMERSGKPVVCLISTSVILSDLLLGQDTGKVGGAEYQQTLIIKMLQELGCEVSVLVHDRGQADEVITDGGVRLIKGYSKDSRVRDNLFFWRHPFWRGLRLADADIYYQRGGGSMTGVIAFLCRMLERACLFSTSTDMDLDGSKEREMNFVKRAVFRYGITHADRVLVQTEDQKANLLKRFGREGVLIRNTYAIQDDPARAESKYVIWVASFRDLKRPELLLDIAAQVPDQAFLMVGGPYQHHPDLYHRIEQQAQAIPNLKLTGMVHPDEVGRYFDQARLLVCTSTVEGFPNTFLQAWSRGVPVVSTVDPDHLIAGLNLGRFCSSLEELVSGVRELSSDEELRREIGERAKEYVIENHHPDAVRAKYRELLDELTASR